MGKIKVGILGATGYTGVELLKHLIFHKDVTVSFAASQSYAGKPFCEVFPEMKKIYDEPCVSTEQALLQTPDCVFSCLPHCESAKLLKPFIDKGAKVIDLSADFRIKNAADYKQWYDHDHPHPELLAQAVFGLCEHNREQIKNCTILANPGCYPTSILLPLLPLYKTSAPLIHSIIADSKSSVSGAGRSLKISSHFVEANETFSAYAVGRKHRHIAEIDQELSAAAHHPVAITFSPHLLPVNRGILSTIYITTSLSADDCAAIAREAYKNEPFVRVRDACDLPNLRDVVHTNFCDIAYCGGGGNQPVIAVCTIDNLLKGAAGQAIQNFNIMYGFAETESLLP